jgi:hypothetical protein
MLLPLFYKSKTCVVNLWWREAGARASSLTPPPFWPPCALFAPCYLPTSMLRTARSRWEFGFTLNFEIAMQLHSRGSTRLPWEIWIWPGCVREMGDFSYFAFYWFRAYRAIRVPVHVTRIWLIKFGFLQVLPDIVFAFFGFGLYGFRYGFSGFGFMILCPSWPLAM